MVACIGRYSGTVWTIGSVVVKIRKFKSVMRFGRRNRLANLGASFKVGRNQNFKPGLRKCASCVGRYPWS